MIFWLLTLALFAQPDLDTLVVEEPPALVTRTPDQAILQLLRPGASIIEKRNQLERAIEEKEGALSEVRDLRDQVATDLDKNTLRFEEITAELQASRTLAAQRLRALRENQRSRWLADLRHGESALSLSETLAARDLLAQADRERLGLYAEQVAAFRKEEKDLKRRQRNLSRLEVQIANLEQDLSWDREEREVLGAAVTEKPEFYAAYAREMDALNDTIQKLLATISETFETPRRITIDKAHGNLAHPIRNGEIVGRYGARTFHDVRSIWRGLHMVPKREQDPTPVRAVFWGWVAWTGWLSGLGKVVIVDHSQEYYSIYAHLSQITIEVGTHVKTGEKLGELGETESFFGPRLYFEFRQNGKAINPMSWLRQ